MNIFRKREFKMKKIYKIILITILMLLLVFSSCIEVNAGGATGTSALDKAKSFAAGTTDETLSKPVGNVAAAVVNAIRVAASAIAAIMIFAVAIKYMSAAPGDRADIKKHAIVYVVGATVLFRSSKILELISTLATTNL